MSNALLFLLESLVVGFIMAAPVGPVGVLCIRRTLRYGWLSGFTTGLGVAVADSVYGALASLGLTQISTALVSHEQIFKLVGGLVLLVMGVSIYRSPAPKGEGESEATPKKHVRNFLSALLLAFTNPLTILSFAAVYIGLGLGAQTEGSLLYAVTFVVGVFLGSCGWWILLSVGTARIKEKITSDYFLKINHICGIVIGLFGVGTLISFFL